MLNSKIRQTVTAAVGALILSTACIGAAVGPVQAATPQAAQAAR